MLKTDNPASLADAAIEWSLEEVAAAVVDFGEAFVAKDGGFVGGDLGVGCFEVCFGLGLAIEEQQGLDIFHAPEAPDGVAPVGCYGEAYDEELAAGAGFVLVANA